MGMRITRWMLAAALGAGVFVGGAAGPDVKRAQACGGLFCSSAQPVNQAAERIIFSFDDVKKEVTAVVEILYSGPAEKFGWVLPVPGVPKVGISTSAVLDRLQSMTNPLYSITRTWADNVCGRGGAGSANTGGSPGASLPPMSSGDGKSPVSVLASGSVGPYQYDVIMVDPDPAVTDKAMVALEWLMKNGYDVSIGREVLQPYLRDGLNLIAFRLQKNTSAGSIRPVMLTYTTDHPMIPIVPTKVAANNDMGILVFVLGARRAVTTNYKSLELNEALINWFTPNMTYNAVVTAAADEAKGQGFVTELAAPTASRGFANALYQEQFTVSEYRRRADTLSNVDLILDVLARFQARATGGFMGPFASRPSGMNLALDGVSDALARHLTLPAGVAIEDVMRRPRCYLLPPTPGAVYCEGEVGPPAEHRLDLSRFDRVKFILDVEALVIQPIEATAKLFSDQAYLTRMYTTLSPAEMTLDPTFDLSTGLTDVDNNHTVTLTYTGGTCGDTGGPWTADVGGLLVRGTGNAWPHDPAAATMPFNRRILQMTANRAPTVDTDNTTVIAKALGGQQPAAVGGSDDGGCSVGGGRANGSLALLGLLGLIKHFGRRRRPR